MLNGHERIGWKALKDSTELVHPYDGKGDFALYADKPSTFIDIKTGEFVAVYLEDAHAPNLHNFYGSETLLDLTKPKGS